MDRLLGLDWPAAPGAQARAQYIQEPVLLTINIFKYLILNILNIQLVD
jgi:hypothetical protein